LLSFATGRKTRQTALDDGPDRHLRWDGHVCSAKWQLAEIATCNCPPPTRRVPQLAQLVSVADLGLDIIKCRLSARLPWIFTTRSPPPRIISLRPRARHSSCHFACRLLPAIFGTPASAPAHSQSQSRPRARAQGFLFRIRLQLQSPGEKCQQPGAGCQVDMDTSAITSALTCHVCMHALPTNTGKHI